MPHRRNYFDDEELKNSVEMFFEKVVNLNCNEVKMKSDELIKAHKFCSNHKEKLLRDQKCGCFYCLEIFSPNKIEEWIDDTSGTAICPYCGVDSIIGESSKYPITKEFF